MNVLDNINTRIGDALKEDLCEGATLCVIAENFSLTAFECLREQLKQIKELQFIFSKPTFLKSEDIGQKCSKDAREFYIPKELRERTILSSEYELKLRNALKQNAVARECVQWIREHARFVSNVNTQTLSSLMCVLGATGGGNVSYLPCQDFTADGLGYVPGNARMVLCTRFSQNEQDCSQVFNGQWERTDCYRDVTEELCATLENAYRENAPELIFYLILFAIFANSLNEPLPNTERGHEETQVWKKLFSFQRDAAIAVINKLEKYDQCLLADSVGLGKTFTALAVIKYYELQNKNVLVFCPKRLANNWYDWTQQYENNIFQKDRFGYTTLFHTDISRKRGFSGNIDLSRINWGAYDLIVIDESHNFRTSTQEAREHESRFRAFLRKVINQGTTNKKVLMLSATPVNNRFIDLRNQILLACGEVGDSSENSENLRSRELAKKLQLKSSETISSVFAKAEGVFQDWCGLPESERTKEKILSMLPQDFLDLLDKLTVARSREHIQKFYENDEFGTFPKHLPVQSFSEPISFDVNAPKISEIFTQISQLNFAVYTPLLYVKAGALEKYAKAYDTPTSRGGNLRQCDRDEFLAALLKVNMLKRLESSVDSFRKTLSRYLSKVEAMCATIERGNGSVDFETVEGNPDFEDSQLDEAIGEKIKIDLDDLDKPAYLQVLKSDFELSSLLLKSLRQIDAPNDAKLQKLKQFIIEKITGTPINAGNKKVLVFATFSDTVEYLYDNLATDFKALGANVAMVTGAGGNVKTTLAGRYDFQEALMYFSPISKDRDRFSSSNKNANIDILFATDCISEGQNLQDCDCLVNYDIHWNPVRLVQRFGRIDRIGSPNEKIQEICFWPDVDLNEYLNLIDRVKNRGVIMGLSATDADFRAEALKKMREQNEILSLENVKTGVSITDVAFNEFRVMLQKYPSLDLLTKLPWGIHAVVAADAENAFPPGVIFVLKSRNEAIVQNAVNYFHPYYLVYVSENGEIVHEFSEPKSILEKLRLLCEKRKTPYKELCKQFNRITKDGVAMEKYSQLLDTAIHSISKEKFARDVDLLLSETKTAIPSELNASDKDFELVSFIVLLEK